MPSTTTPNMNLILPTPGQEQGPAYAQEVNNDFSTLDSHDHSSGKGVPITPAGITISSDLSFLSNNGTALRSIRFDPQGSALALGTDLGCLYEFGVDLYYNDGNGNQIRLTQSGSIAGVSGSITNLVSPASVVFSSGSATYIFQSNTSIAGNLDAGSIILRNVSPNSTFGLTLSPPSALASNYSVVLPTLPGSTSFLTLDSSGNMGASIPTSQGLTAANISATAGITGSQLSASAGITGGQIASATITDTNLTNNIDLPGTDPSVSGGFRIISGNANNASAMVISRANVSSAGALLSGEGIGSSKTGTGNYDITYSTAFVGVTPTVVVCSTESLKSASVTTSSTTGCHIITNITGGGVTDSGFNLIIMGHRN